MGYIKILNHNSSNSILDYQYTKQVFLMRSKFLERKLAEFKGLRKSRKISVAMLISLIITFQIISAIAIIVISDTLQIISGAVVPSGSVSINIDYTQPGDMEVSIPYYIENPGLSRLEDISLSIKLSVNYTHESTREVLERNIFFEKEKLSACEPLSVLVGRFEGEFSCFNISALILFWDEMDPFVPFSVLGDIDIKANYFLKLIKINIYHKSINFF